MQFYSTLLKEILGKAAPSRRRCTRRNPKSKGLRGTVTDTEDVFDKLATQKSGLPQQQVLTFEIVNSGHSDLFDCRQKHDHERSFKRPPMLERQFTTKSRANEQCFSDPQPNGDDQEKTKFSSRMCGSTRVHVCLILKFFFGRQHERWSMGTKTLQQLSDTWPYGQEQQIRERERGALKRRQSRPTRELTGQCNELKRNTRESTENPRAVSSEPECRARNQPRARGVACPVRNRRARNS